SVMRSSLSASQRPSQRASQWANQRASQFAAMRMSRATTKIDIPMMDNRTILERHIKRHDDDKRYMGQFDDKPITEYFTYKPKHDDHDICLMDPSYTNFKVPVEVRCRERLMSDTIRYNRQLNTEISKLIEYQNTALEAAYFVRVMSYTTLWPPYHSNVEIDNTNRNFYRLSKKEQDRFDFIMSHEFS
ncbi:hypothetical protein KR059_009823, partial [Drosophila kikkawai]